MQKHTACLILSAAVVVSIASPAGAQSTITSPPGYETRNGNTTSFYLGRYSDGRFQVADGEVKGKAMTISRFDFRLDNRSHTTSTALGRTWSRVTLDMSETNVDDLSLTWDHNNLTTPTRVFDSSMTWPTVTGRPSSTPWGHVSFPFTKVWIYTGKNDMLTDYQFHGGTLANSARWTGSNTRYYYLDGLSNQDAISGSGTWIPPSANNCNDSALSATTGAYTYGYATAFHEWYTTYTYRDKLRLYWYSYYTAPEKPVIHALGIGQGYTAGFEIGARCHRLYLEASLPYVLITRTTRNTTSAFSEANQIIIPWLNNWQGLRFHVQGAWADSSTSAFSLTRARSFVVPSYPTNIRRKRTVFHYNATLGYGLGPYSTYAALPLPLITYR